MKLYQDDYIDTRDAMLLFTIGDCDEVYFIQICFLSRVLSKRRAWQGSNLQSSDSQSDAFPLRHRPFLLYGLYSLLLSLVPTVRLDYPFRYLSSVGSYQVGYTRSHPNTEVKMLRACSVPLCSHRWERQVIYLLFFFIITITTVITTLPHYPYSISYPDITVPDICPCWSCSAPTLSPFCLFLFAFF